MQRKSPTSNFISVFLTDNHDIKGVTNCMVGKGMQI